MPPWIYYHCKLLNIGSSLNLTKEPINIISYLAAPRLDELPCFVVGMSNLTVFTSVGPKDQFCQAY